MSVGQVIAGHSDNIIASGLSAALFTSSRLAYQFWQQFSTIFHFAFNSASLHHPIRHAAAGSQNGNAAASAPARRHNTVGVGFRRGTGRPHRSGRAAPGSGRPPLLVGTGCPPGLPIQLRMPPAPRFAGLFQINHNAAIINSPVTAAACRRRTHSIAFAIVPFAFPGQSGLPARGKFAIHSLLLDHYSFNNRSAFGYSIPPPAILGAPPCTPAGVCCSRRPQLHNRDFPHRSLIN